MTNLQFLYGDEVMWTEDGTPKLMGMIIRKYGIFLFYRLSTCIFGDFMLLTLFLEQKHKISQVSYKSDEVGSEPLRLQHEETSL